MKVNNIYKYKFFKFLYLVFCDIRKRAKSGRVFDLFGLTIFVGKQGQGKTISMVEYLERMRLKYPMCKIYTNFDYANQDGFLDSWELLFSVRNGSDGVIFAIDEIQNEYDSTKWKDFPEGLLSQITMQRKQKIKIICSSQVYSRMVKQLREQCFEVVECRTVLGRFTVTRCFDAWEYESYYSNPDKKNKLSRLWRWSYVQNDQLRSLYDTDLVVENMSKLKVLPRDVRFI